MKDQFKENEKLSQTPVGNSIERIGYVVAMNGHELLINTESDEMVKITVNDKETRHKFYCNKVKVTIEILPSSSSPNRN